MDGVSGVGTKRHFSSEEEEALKRDEGTSSIVKRDKGVEIHGHDASWRTTKEAQQTHLGVGAAEIFYTAMDGAELVGWIHTAGTAGMIGGPLAAFGLGLYELREAQVKGEEQARALAQDNAHVALIGTLDLPAAYKNVRLDGDYKHVAKTSNSPAANITAALNADPKGRAVLQLHADRGMHAARDMVASGLSQEAFLEANPNVAVAYRKDAAFHEGFDAHLFAKTTMAPAEFKAMDAKLHERDGWYAQSQVRVSA